MSLWIAVHLPLLQLEVFRPNWDDEIAAVVFHHDRVSALSAAARAQGVREGMRRGSVQLLSPQASAHERDMPRESTLLDDLALALLQYTPQVTLAEHDCVLLDVGASLRLFGGLRALCRKVRTSIARLGLSATLSCAVTASGAGLLARFGYVRTLRQSSLQRHLDRLPVVLLSAALPHLEWLHGLGCHQLGELRRLPRAGLQRRCGKGMLDMLDRAYGHTPELHRWVSAPPSFRMRLELPDRIEQADLLERHAQRLLTQLAGWLAARQLALEQLRLLLEHERGRQAMAPTEIRLSLAAPTWEEEHLLLLLREKLTRSQLSAPAIAMVLTAERVQPRAPLSDTLFPEPGGSADDQRRLIELLVARLGADHVLQAVPEADHRPEASNRWHSVLQRPAQQLRSALSGNPAHLPPRPLWLLDTALPLALHDNQPVYRGALTLASPVERIEAGWWEGQPVTRDYYTAHDARHVYYWIFRQWLASEGHRQSPQWFLHGLFG